MASIPSDSAQPVTAAPEAEPDWESEMKVTFDADELASFFDGFDPLDLLTESSSGPGRDG
ncbi:MAG: hypothetical protein HY903_01520 [Deltaproteobacteria bacterium]|nr:hypothetical protein [Deltaproteobacteria bacterium]